jgi:hypothetical protein
MEIVSQEAAKKGKLLRAYGGGILHRKGQCRSKARHVFAYLQRREDFLLRGRVSLHSKGIRSGQQESLAIDRKVGQCVQTRDIL